MAASDATASDLFGYSVAIDGNTVVIGAPYAGGGAAYVRAVVGGAVAFETTVDGGAAFPDASWDEAYEVGCNLGERVELRVVDRDGGLLGGTNLGDLDLGLADVSGR